MTDHVTKTTQCGAPFFMYTIPKWNHFLCSSVLAAVYQGSANFFQPLNNCHAAASVRYRTFGPLGRWLIKKQALSALLRDEKVTNEDEYYRVARATWIKTWILREKTLGSLTFQWMDEVSNYADAVWAYSSYVAQALLPVKPHFIQKFWENYGFMVQSTNKRPAKFLQFRFHGFSGF